MLLSRGYNHISCGVLGMGTLASGSPLRATIQIGALFPEPSLTSVSQLLVNEFPTVFPTFAPTER
jgi:hypothetical protein